jgi:O-antigen/teichoic acid export membrane protein
VPAGARRLEPAAWLKSALPLLSILACELMLQNADVLIISRHLTPSEVAVYFAAAKTISMVLFVHYAVGSAAASGFSALDARGDKAGLRAAVSAAVNWTFWPSLALAGLILALGRPLLKLFGPAFVDGHKLMLPLAIGFLARAPWAHRSSCSTCSGSRGCAPSCWWQPPHSASPCASSSCRFSGRLAPPSRAPPA